MSGTLVCYVPPPNSPWSFFGPSDMEPPYPEVLNSEGPHTLGWNLLLVNNVLTIEFLLKKHGVGATLETIQRMTIPAEPTFSLFHMACEEFFKKDAKDNASLTEIFGQPDAVLSNINDEMADQNLFLKELLSRWIKPGPRLDMLTADLYTCITGDVNMALNMLRPSGPDSSFPGK